mgnify:CR=1 FL=1
MDVVILKVSSFAFIILSGIVAGRSGKLGNRAGEIISKLVFSFTLPAAIINAFGSADFTPHMLLLIPAGFICTFVPYAIAFIASRNSSREDRILYLMNMSGFNIGSFGLPFVQTFFPASAVVASCMFDAGNAFMSTGGTFAVTSTIVNDESAPHPVLAGLRRLFSSVPFDTYIVLVALAVSGMRIPEPLITFTQPIASANAFLAMFMLGLMVGFTIDRDKLHKLFNLLGGRIAMMSVLTLNFLPFDYQTRCVVLLLLWCPIGSTGPVFTLWAGGDHRLAGLANTLSIILGIMLITIIIIITG